MTLDRMMREASLQRKHIISGLSDEKKMLKEYQYKVHRM